MTTSSNLDIEVLNQLIDDEDGCYRLRIGSQVHYVTISAAIFDKETMCRPDLLIPKLPDLRNVPWTKAIISRNGDDGSLKLVPLTTPLPGVEMSWHQQQIDVLSLERTQRFCSGVHEVQYNGSPAIAKIACFEWDIPRIRRETWAYSVIARYQKEHPNDTPIAPKCLGHLTENGRLMGLLLEKVHGDPACIDDLAKCEALVRRVHSIGLIHGDLNRYNFVVDRNSGSSIRLVDFETAKDFDPELAKAELQSLPAELTEETGRGWVVLHK